MNQFPFVYHFHCLLKWAIKSLYVLIKDIMTLDSSNDEIFNMQYLIQY